MLKREELVTLAGKNLSDNHSDLSILFRYLTKEEIEGPFNAKVKEGVVHHPECFTEDEVVKDMKAALMYEIVDDVFGFDKEKRFNRFADVLMVCRMIGEDVEWFDSLAGDCVSDETIEMVMDEHVGNNSFFIRLAEKYGVSHPYNADGSVDYAKAFRILSEYDSFICWLVSEREKKSVMGGARC